MAQGIEKTVSIANCNMQPISVRATMKKKNKRKMKEKGKTNEERKKLGVIKTES